MNYKNYFKNTKNFITTDIFFFLTLSIIIFFIYGKSINYEILRLDDDILICNNINFISDIKNIPKAFITNCFYDKNPNSYYRPVLSLSFLTETLIFGGKTKIYHSTNIILFILSILLMYVLLKNLQFNKNILKMSLLLLSVHPALVSVPVWISGRNDSLLVIFTLLTLIFTFYYFNKNTISSFLLVFCFFSLSLFTKESSIVLLLILPIFLFSINKFNIKKILYLYMSFLLIIFIFFFLRNLSGINNSSILNLSNLTILLKKTIFGFILYINKFFVPNYIPIMIVNIEKKIII